LPEKQFDFNTQCDYIRETTINSLPTPNDPMITMDVRLSFTEEIHQRSYMKIQNLCAIIGGLFSFLKLVAGYLSLFLFEPLFYIDIINENFNSAYPATGNTSQNNNLQSGGKKKRKVETNNYVNSISNNSRENSNQQNDVARLSPFNFELNNNKNNNTNNNTNNVNIENVNKIEKDLKSLNQDRKLKYTWSEYLSQHFCYCFCSKSKLLTPLFYSKGKKYINKMMDINQLLKKQVEFERLKYLVLKKSELIVFNSLPRPLISEEDEGQFCDIINNKSDVFIQSQKNVEFKEGLFHFNLLKSESSYENFICLVDSGTKKILGIDEKN